MTNPNNQALQDEPEAVTHYVVGFALDNLGCIALIQKARPAWQAGRLNGIGGHVELGETPDAAMVREFEEETGVRVDDWQLFVRMTFPGAVIHFYRARIAAAVMLRLHSATDEQVGVFPLHMVRDDAFWPIVPNLSWLIPLAAYTADNYEPLEVAASAATTLSEQGQPDA